MPMRKINGVEFFNELESKKILREYGIPVTREMAAADEIEAFAAAKAIGYPVVVKGLGKALTHKTDRGLVHLHIKNPTGVAAALKQITEAAGKDLEGFLVQPQVIGKRELAAGLFRDPHFGPVVLFGVGGIFAEAFSDVSFRVAPFGRDHALRMIREIRSQALLGPFRGEKEVQLEQLVNILIALSKIGTDHPEISEIDINPLIVNSDGALCAVDALVVKRPESDKEATPLPVDPALLGKFFRPKSIAFVGVSSQIGKWGHMLFSITVSGGFEGDIFLVNSKGGPIAGRQVYRSVEEIPSEVDLGVVTVPARHVLPLIPQFAKKNIQNMLLITSGFAETGPEGKALELRLIEEARKAGIVVIGPNTMGICNPHINLYCTGSHVQPMAGATAVVSQSGNMGTQLLAFAEQQGIGIRGFCGSGNEAMVTTEDFLDAFETDALTKTVMLYIESIKNGRRFMDASRRVGKKKPIVLLKGGKSNAGVRAAATHTGALAHNRRIFDAACRQAGIVLVDHPMDLLDLSAAFASLPLPKGNRAAIMTLGGGWGVVTVDLCAEFGLEVPDLPDKLKADIDRLLPDYWSRTNPVDLVGEKDIHIPIKVMELLTAWDGCDAVINLGIFGRRFLIDRLGESVLKADPGYSPSAVEAMTRFFRDFETDYIVHIVNLMDRFQKPIFGVSLITDQKDKTVFPIPGSTYSGIFFPTPERAVKAFGKMFEYQKFIKSLDSKNNG
ncbi:MAG: CoA-binding protein [Desulfobacterales bacterium CG07_land_8_20_14_0_80_52_14]|nr:MAG: CoA-binding protein [Desulfobacterales bacterium CG07_land_8_20_14_0_80_52_14]